MSLLDDTLLNYDSPDSLVIDTIKGAKDLRNICVMAGKLTVAQLSLGSNMRGSAQYRKIVCQNMIERMIMEVYG